MVMNSPLVYLKQLLKAEDQKNEQEVRRKIGFKREE
jgi:hypothetical protein